MTGARQRHRAGFSQGLPGSTRAVALVTAVVGAISLASAVTTPPRSGPWCTSDCVDRPYTDVASYVPRDYLWMYPGTLLAVLFLVLVAHLHRAAAPEARAWSTAGVGLAVVATTALVIDYGLQLTVVQPSLLRGETEGLSLFSQYNPHGIFIALENVGYLAMSLALLLVGLALRVSGRAERALRWLFVGGGLLTVGLLVVLALVYRDELDYRFEVWAILVNWLVLIVSGVLLARLARGAGRGAAGGSHDAST